MNLKEFRKEKKLTQIEMAQILQVNQQAYSRLENSDSILSIKNALKLNEHFGISLDEIYGITKEEQEQGLGNHPTTLSKEEWEWLELGSETLRIKGADYYQSLKTMIKAVINNP